MFCQVGLVRDVSGEMIHWQGWIVKNSRSKTWTLKRKLMNIVAEFHWTIMTISLFDFLVGSWITIATESNGVHGLGRFALRSGAVEFVGYQRFMR